MLLLWKGFCPYKDIADCEKLNKNSLSEEEDFYSHLNIENIMDGDYTYARRVDKGFKINNLCEYHALWVQIDTLLLATDIFENFWNMSRNIWTWNCSFSYCTRF